ncbi:DNA translocase FtsK [Peribacillus glennii]|uniref:DNA translocase FtsK n=2 Tax=Peribacillus glennii TaxID=2303991 RepID=A0A372LJK3_9BACI|nr:DNA translocase FtsK [Peribacillus glennii]
MEKQAPAADPLVEFELESRLAQKKISNFDPEEIPAIYRKAETESTEAKQNGEGLSLEDADLGFEEGAAHQTSNDKNAVLSEIAVSSQAAVSFDQTGQENKEVSHKKPAPAIEHMENDGTINDERIMLQAEPMPASIEMESVYEQFQSDQALVEEAKEKEAPIHTELEREVTGEPSMAPVQVQEEPMPAPIEMESVYEQSQSVQAFVEEVKEKEAPIYTELEREVTSEPGMASVQVQAEPMPAPIEMESVYEQSQSDQALVEEAKEKEAPIHTELEQEVTGEPGMAPVQVQEEDQEEISNQDETETAPNTSRKKHIPFNVLMTKQDRDRVQQLKKEGDFPNAATAIEEIVTQAEITEKPAEPEPTLHAEKADAFDLDGDPPFYAFPAIDLLSPPAHAESDRDWLEEQARLLNDTLKNFNVRAHVVNVTQGPAVTRFEVQPEPGVKVNKITNLTDDIKLSLAAEDIRMEAPIPGKHTIGIEIPNLKSKPVFLREVLDGDAFQNDGSPLTVALGLDISGKPIVTDLKKMPHGLIAGATGSGKSVCINTMLVSLLYKATPQELKLLLIDPKMVELAPYNRIPHLVSPVITDVKAATAALKWAVEEMERRYELFAHTGVRDIGRFNEMADRAGQHADKLPYIVVIIDELADLMMMSPADVEEAICRIAQKARACGIHLIVATQRPSVDVITGLIKANIPTRIAFSVSSQVDSRTILDSSGAEKLLGKGDMLFAENGSSKTVRLQGTFVSDDEIEQVVNHVKQEQEPNYLFEQDELLSRAQVIEDTDELFYEACEFAVNQNGASASSLQRRFHIGYNRAARLIEMMERQGILSESRGSKPRDVLISVEELEYILESNGGN